PGLAAALGVPVPDLQAALVVAGTTLALTAAGLVVLRRWFSRRMRVFYKRWAAEPGRTAHERAAASFYSAAYGAGSRLRGEAVARCLAAIPPGASTVIIMGTAAAEPVDDGTLSEECDAYEGRARHAPRWLVAALAVPLLTQVTAFLSLRGLGAVGLPPWGYLLGAIAVLNAVALLVAFGLVRPPGSVALVTPRCLVHANLRGERRFTPDDSVVLIAGVKRSHVVMVFRNDGRIAALQYASLQAPGFRHLINRWCMRGSAGSERAPS
ncbi:MAG TPA: hypothetical protein VEB22_10390, partial [Phycisphaerales bacterium]|nr:hypothetical protein [Phycisphaerales bacterium]